MMYGILSAPLYSRLIPFACMTGSFQLKIVRFPIAIRASLARSSTTQRNGISIFVDTHRAAVESDSPDPVQASSTQPRTAGNSLGTRAISPRSGVVIPAGRVVGSMPTQNHGEWDTPRVPSLTQMNTKVTDFCFPGFPVETLQQWEAMEFNNCLER